MAYAAAGVSSSQKKWVMYRVFIGPFEITAVSQYLLA